MNQLENITNHCDGYTQVSPEDVENYKQLYFYKEKEGELLFPFVYKKLFNGIMPQNCIIMIKKNELIQVSEENKTIISF